MGIRSYEVTQPPTSGGVEDHILDSIRTRSLARVTIRATGEDILRGSDEQELAFTIRQTGHPAEGGMSVLGDTTDGDTVNLALSPTPEQPATLTLVVPD